MSKDDPIVFPGQPGASHLHTFFGNTLTNAFSTADSLRNTGNSTCRGGTANRTAYWIPSLLDLNGIPIAPTEAVFYYKSGYNIPNVSSRISLIPSGLRMVAGDPKATSANHDSAGSWGCTNVYRGHNPAIIDCDIGDSIQLDVNFPQCWNGRDLDSPDHRSHMAYPDGQCPATHPVILPEISLHIRWSRTPTTKFYELRLASDMYDTRVGGGYSAHADWFEGWRDDVKESFVRNCVNASRDCHAHLTGDGREMY